MFGCFSGSDGGFVGVESEAVEFLGERWGIGVVLIVSSCILADLSFVRGPTEGE